MKTEIKSHGDEVTDFYDKEIPKVDSILKKDENYYPQLFLKECKYIKKKVIRHINDSLTDFSSSDCFDDSDEE